MCLPSSSYIASHSIGGKVKHVAIPSCTQDHCMAKISFYFACYEVTGDDATSFAFNSNNIEHLMAAVHVNFSHTNLSFKSRISSQQQLLTGLSGSIESTLNLHSTEGSIA